MERIITVIAVNFVRSCSTGQIIIADSAMDQILTVIAMDRIMAASAVDIIVASAASDVVIELAANNQVVSSVSVDRNVSQSGEATFGDATQVDLVRSVASIDDDRLYPGHIRCGFSVWALKLDAVAVDCHITMLVDSELD